MQKLNKITQMLIKAKLRGEEDDVEKIVAARLEAALAEQAKAFEARLNNASKLLEEKRESEKRNKELEQSLKSYKDKEKELENQKLMEKGEFEKVLENERLEMQKIISDKEVKLSDYEKILKEKDYEMQKYKMESIIKNKLTSVEDFNIKASGDFTRSALEVFNAIDEKGNLIVKDANGVIKLNKVGQNYGFDDFTEEQREPKSYWFNQKQGSNLGNADFSSTGKIKMTSTEVQRIMSNPRSEEAAKLKQAQKEGRLLII